VAIPSLVYNIQNNLLYVGATHLDAATCQVTYQLKILTTAVFSLALLQKKISKTQWAALFVLFAGVALVQLAQLGAPAPNPSGHVQRPMVGFLAIVAACCLSGFAGVYFEKILKGSDVSVWMRNVQLSTFAVPFGLLTTLVSDYEEVHTRGFFHGYNALIWTVILLQALGGLLVAVVVKYADNILKGFATSLAIVLSCVVSVYAFEFQLTGKFVVGAGLVMGSIFLYSKPPSPTASLHSRRV
ncbi:putative UDP-galactose transporter, partial [Ixodes scapularis]